MMNRTHLTNGFAIVLAEVSNRLVVRNKPARRGVFAQPREGDVSVVPATKTSTLKK